MSLHWSSDNPLIDFYLSTAMFPFFKVSVFIAIISQFLLSLITLSDVFIHSNQTRFYVITIVVALLFLAMALTGIAVFRSFKNIHEHITAEKQTGLALSSLRKLLLFFGLMALVIGLISGSLCFALIERMAAGTALFG